MGMNISENFNEFENYYICSSSLETGEFVRLSSTEYTGYPNELNNVGRQYCKDENGVKGKWVSVKKYAEENNLKIEDLIEPEQDEEPTFTGIRPGDKFTCNSDGCVKVQ